MLAKLDDVQHALLLAQHTLLLFLVAHCRGLSHYAGGAFSGSPLMLAAVTLCAMLPAAMRAVGAAVLFCAFDLASALLLRAICVRAVAVESCEW